MTRRRRARSRRRQKPPNRWLIAIQLLVLSGLLVFLVLFRDYLAHSASRAVDAMTSSDLQVQRADAGDDAGSAGTAPAPEGRAPSPDGSRTRENGDDAFSGKTKGKGKDKGKGKVDAGRADVD